MFFFKFIYVIIYRAFYIILNRKKEEKWGTDLLYQLEQQFDGKFDERTFKKIIFYYGLKVPAICDGFLDLHNKKTNRQECERLLHYFICSSVFDNFFDREELTDDEIYNITFNSNAYTASNFNERISLNSHLFILNFVKNKEHYLQVLKKEYDVQVASRKQFSINITDAELENITLEKGGNAVLLTSFYLDTPATIHEQNCWYKLGNIIQFVNDLFDIYRDLQSGLQTIPNRIKNIKEFKKYYLNLIESLQKEIAAIDVAEKQKLHFKISMMGVCALGIIAIEQLEKIQGNQQQMPDFKTLNRKDLIVDMELKSNLWKWLKVVYSLSK